MMEIHVIANGDLFRETFNAVVTVLGTSTFSTAIRLSVLFSILGAVISYIKTNDLVIFAQWFMFYFAVTVILLGPKVSVEIIDSSNPGAVYTVDHVPYGLAFPASFITSIAHGLENNMELAFHMPDDASYSKTGLLFGSKIYKLSTNFHLIDPEARANFSQYMKNCVTGDILINKKYGIKDLLNTPDIWQTITQNPSPARGVLLSDGSFKTCQEAVPIIKKGIDSDVTDNSFKIFGVRIFGGNDVEIDAVKLKNALANAYNYYAGLSKSAQEIMTQNVLVNAAREGITDYTSEAGATASLVNLSSTESMQKMRMAWATSGSMITYVLPLMQTDILLLLIAMFPLVILLSIQPLLGFRVFKQYIYSLLWVESWPILFSCLNLAVTFYAQNKTAGLAQGGLTLSNIDQLALEHSDVANMAGYLMTCVPFIAGGIITGMSAAFSSASQYIGGMMHSTASGAASEAATGNISLGNTSYGNVNANKFDTNSTFMHGMATEQIANGAVVTHTPAGAGHDIYNTSGAMSNLATTLHAGSAVSASLSHQAENAKSSALQQMVTHDHAVSNAASKLESFGDTSSFTKSAGESYTNQKITSIAQHASDMYSNVDSVAKHNNTTWDKAFRGLTEWHQNLGGNFSVSNPGGKTNMLSIGGGIDIGFNHSRSNSEGTSHSLSTQLNVTNEEARRFDRDYNAIKQYNDTQHADTSHSKVAAELSQLSQDLRTADTASSNASSSFVESQRLSDMANLSQQDSKGFDTVFTQVVAETIQKNDPGRAPYLLANTNNPSVMAEVQTYARRVLNSPEHMGQITELYNQKAANISPQNHYNSSIAKVNNGTPNLNTDYQKGVEGIKFKAKAEGTNFNDSEYNNTKGNTQSGQMQQEAILNKQEFDMHHKYVSSETVGKEEIKEGAKDADGLWVASTKPNFIDKEEIK